MVLFDGLEKIIEARQDKIHWFFRAEVSEKEDRNVGEASEGGYAGGLY